MGAKDLETLAEDFYNHLLRTPKTLPEEYDFILKTMKTCYAAGLAKRNEGWRVEIGKHGAGDISWWSATLIYNGQEEEIGRGCDSADAVRWQPFVNALVLALGAEIKIIGEEKE